MVTVMKELHWSDMQSFCSTYCICLCIERNVNRRFSKSRERKTVFPISFNLLSLEEYLGFYRNSFIIPFCHNTLWYVIPLRQCNTRAAFVVLLACQIYWAMQSCWWQCVDSYKPSLADIFKLLQIHIWLGNNY